MNQTGVVGCFLKEEGSPDAVWKSAYPTIPVTTQRRFIFTNSQTWKVPKGVTSGFITMAGGGGTGFGWRAAKAHVTGHSGGYVFSHAVTLIPDETLTIEVGKGGGLVNHPKQPLCMPSRTRPFLFTHHLPAGIMDWLGIPVAQAK